MIFWIHNKSDVTQLLNTLENNPKLDSIHLVGNNNFRLIASDISAIFAYIDKSIEKITLRFSKIFFSEEALDVLVREMRANSTVITLDLGDNLVLDDKNGVMIASFLEHNTTLTALVLTGNTFGAKAGAAFAKALMVNKTLTKLDLTRNIRASDEEVAKNGNLLSSTNNPSFAEMLAKNTTLRTLDVQLHSMKEEEDLVALAKSINVNKTLINLHIDNCIRYADYCEIFLSCAFAENQTLRTLAFSSNQADGASVAKLLSKNISLTTLSLAGMYTFKDLINIHMAIERRDTPLDLCIDTGCDEKEGDEEEQMHKASWDTIIDQIQKTRKSKMQKISNDCKLQREAFVQGIDPRLGAESAVRTFLNDPIFAIDVLQSVFALADMQDPFRDENVDEVSEEQENKELIELSYSLGYTKEQDDAFVQEVQTELQRIDQQLQQPRFTPGFSAVMQVAESSAPTNSLKPKTSSS